MEFENKENGLDNFDSCIAEIKHQCAQMSDIYSNIKKEISQLKQHASLMENGYSQLCEEIGLTVDGHYTKTEDKVDAAISHDEIDKILLSLPSMDSTILSDIHKVLEKEYTKNH